MMKDTGDPEIRAKVIDMVEKCPSGTLTFAADEDSEKQEPDLPREISVVAEGSQRVSGGIRIDRRDGKSVEVRNRITLCRCGKSENKPFCDGKHKDVGFAGS